MDFVIQLFNLFSIKPEVFSATNRTRHPLGKRDQLCLKSFNALASAITYILFLFDKRTEKRQLFWLFVKSHACTKNFILLSVKRFIRRPDTNWKTL